MAEQLLGCPFCGARGEELGLCYETGQTPMVGTDWFVRCYVCHVETSRQDTKAEAITAWNTRPSLAPMGGLPEAEYTPITVRTYSMPQPPSMEEVARVIDPLFRNPPYRPKDEALLEKAAAILDLFKGRAG